MSIAAFADRSLECDYVDEKGRDLHKVEIVPNMHIIQNTVGPAV